MTHLVNPVLRGFNPDPSILRVGADYYIATSTFEWSPLVRLHHSRDLVHWRTLGHAVDSAGVLDLRGVPDSGGVWAPSLSHHDGLFWLVLSIVRTMDGDAKDLDNYLLTAPDITGPWSEPVRLNSRGFDASLFHDRDGRHWLVGVQWDPRPGRTRFAGISLQEYDAKAGRLVGDSRIVARDAGLIEGPNLYWHDGYYYLMLAQGGTGFNHGISMLRSRSLDGEFERDPQYSLLTSRDDPEWELQKAGHGELVQTPDGDWYLAHLASRTSRDDQGQFAVTGRETCLQRVAWTEDGWLRLADDQGRPVTGTRARTRVRSTAAASGTTDGPALAPGFHDDFSAPRLDRTRWSALRRRVHPGWLDLEARPGRLRLHGGQSRASVFEQSLIGTRIEEPTARVATRIEARPRTTGHRAGLVAWYDRRSHYGLYLTLDDDGRRVLLLQQCTPAGTSHLGEPVPVHDWSDLHLGFALDGPSITFSAGPDPHLGAWTGPTLSSRPLSDDYRGLLRFTGAFAALRVDDHDGDGFSADIDHLTIDYPLTPA
ncbi:glycoside hydrolase family 43 protein [Streptacidiphilus sp. N1-10]|uniref:Glycoside hydrolase family 43 protein n=1 Tax=Streptacidiphilus jeojiensis TaxID=3229225 RepID=A0ABV6XFR3_9ACTN